VDRRAEETVDGLGRLFRRALVADGARDAGATAAA
jgi:hypothetical protein